MKKCIILVEGQTEEAFVNQLLISHFNAHQMNLIPIVVKTKQTAEGQTYKGGISKYAKIKSELKRLLNDTSATVFTTLFDYYGLPTDFPGYSPSSKSSAMNSFEHKTEIESAFAKDICDRRFIPYLQIHEFESLLFSATEHIASAFPSIKKCKTTLDQDVASFDTPEHINNSQQTAPSKRLIRICEGYNKVVHGSVISKKIGLNIIRQKCPCFDAWITLLENLAKQT